jgi:hypothetical protein
MTRLNMAGKNLFENVFESARKSKKTSLNT